MAVVQIAGGSGGADGGGDPTETNKMDLLECAWSGHLPSSITRAQEILKNCDSKEVEVHLMRSDGVMGFDQSTGATALHLAARRGQVKMLKLLLKYYKDHKAAMPANFVDIPTLRNTTPHETPLHLAAKSGVDVAEVKSGVDVAEESRNCVEVMKVLLENGAKVHLRDSDGRTAFCMARQFSLTDKTPRDWDGVGKTAVEVLKEECQKRGIKCPAAPEYRVLMVNERVLPSVIVEVKEESTQKKPSLRLLLRGRSSATSFTVCSLGDIFSPGLRDKLKNATSYKKICFEANVEDREGETAQTLPILRLKLKVELVEPERGAEPYHRIVLCRTSELPLTIGGLKPSSKYKVSIAAISALGTGPYGKWMGVSEKPGEKPSITVATLPRLCAFVRRCLKCLGAQNLPGKSSLHVPNHHRMVHFRVSTRRVHDYFVFILLYYTCTRA